MPRCKTCRWWCHATQTDDTAWALCVWHNGARKSQAETMRFRGLLETHETFGCPRHEERETPKP